MRPDLLRKPLTTRSSHPCQTPKKPLQDDDDFFAYATPQNQIKKPLSSPPSFRKKKLPPVDVKHQKSLAEYGFMPPPPSLFRYTKTLGNLKKLND